MCSKNNDYTCTSLVYCVRNSSSYHPLMKNRCNNVQPAMVQRMGKIKASITRGRPLIKTLCALSTRRHHNLKGSATLGLLVVCAMNPAWRVDKTGNTKLFVFITKPLFIIQNKPSPFAKILLC